MITEIAKLGPANSELGAHWITVGAEQVPIERRDHRNEKEPGYRGENVVAPTNDELGQSCGQNTLPIRPRAGQLYSGSPQVRFSNCAERRQPGKHKPDPPFPPQHPEGEDNRL